MEYDLNRMAAFRAKKAGEDGRPGAAPVDVSVLMPVRNAGPFLPEALESVLEQSGVRFELICVDDGSGDGSWDTLTQFAQRHGHMRAIRAEDRGIARALNQACALAQGRYIARMDQDDVCLPGRLAIQARYLDQHPEVGVLGSQAIVVDTKGQPYGRQRVPVGPARVRAALSTSSPLIHPTVMMRREALLRVGGYRKLFDAAEDYELWLRLASIVELDNLPDPLLLYRRHPGSATAWRPFRQARRAAIAVVAYRLRVEHGQDPLAGMSRMSHWREAFRAIDPAAVDEVRYLTAGFLADNGGSLGPLGRKYFRLACRSVRRLDDRRLRLRLALACVRHELQLLRNERRLEAAVTTARDVAAWPGEMIQAYVMHASILWRVKRRARLGLPPAKPVPPRPAEIRADA